MMKQQPNKTAKTANVECKLFDHKNERIHIQDPQQQSYLKIFGI